MILSHWNFDTAASRFITSRLSPLDEINKTMPSWSVPSDPEFVAEHKPLEPNPHRRVSQIHFLFGRRNEMWVRVRPKCGRCGRRWRMPGGPGGGGGCHGGWAA